MQADSLAWLSLIRQRHQQFTHGGSAFVQMFIPEKTSVLADLAPLEFDPPYSWYQVLMERLAQSDLPAGAYLDVNAIVAASDQSKACYRKLDSHLSSLGAQLVMTTMLRQLGCYDFIERPMDHGILEPGDLGRKFFKEMGSENTLSLWPADYDELSSGLEHIVSEPPTVGKNVGMRHVFRRQNAPIDMKVVAFANSFFAWGQSPSYLTWWCARLFKEFHFIWGPDVDHAYIEREKPDLVIAQTIERFLIKVPQV